jgi:hypothetical protein
MYITQTNGGTVTYSNTYAYDGSLSAKTVCSSTTQYALMEWPTGDALFTGDVGLATRCYLYVGTMPSAATDIICIRNAGNATKITLDNSGVMRVLDNASATKDTWTAISTGTWYRIELLAIKGTGTTDGTIKGAYYVGDSLTATDSYSATNVNTGTVNLTGVRWGHVTNTTTSTLYWDACSAKTSAVYLGPWPATKSRPILTDSNPGVWTISGGSTAHEVTADDSDSTLIQSPDTPVDDKITFRMFTLQEDGTIVITVRAKANQASPVGVLTTTLKQDTTTIASWNDNMTASWANYTHTLTPSEMANVTDRNSLFVELNADV